MPESLHDIAMKLGLLNDIGSFKQGEKLMRDFAEAAIAQQRRVKAAATDLSGTDKYLAEPNKNILKQSQIEKMKQESLFSLDDKLAQGTLSRTEYNKALEETQNRWIEISHAQQANTVILQHQQALQSINSEHIEDEIQRQKHLLELKQDLNARTQQTINLEEQQFNSKRQWTDSADIKRRDAFEFAAGIRDPDKMEENAARLKQDILNRTKQILIAEKEISEEKIRQLSLVNSLVEKAARERDIALNKIAKQDLQDRSDAQTHLNSLIDIYNEKRYQSLSIAEKLSILNDKELAAREEVIKAGNITRTDNTDINKALDTVNTSFTAQRSAIDGTNERNENRLKELADRERSELLERELNIRDKINEAEKLQAQQDKDKSDAQIHLNSLIDTYNEKQYQSLSVAEKLSILADQRLAARAEVGNASLTTGAEWTDISKALDTINTNFTAQRNAIDGTNDKLREYETLKRRSLSLLGTYSEMTDRVTEDMQTLTSALQQNIITQEQFDKASAVANTRMSQMRGGSGNLMYAVGELGRGLEDFITVMSITGFSTQGFGMAMRGASNNISQATMLMTSVNYMWLGSAIGIGAVLIGQLVPYIFGTTKRVDELTMAFERNKAAIDNMASALSRMMENKFKLEDIGSIKTSSEAGNISKQTNAREIEKNINESNKLSQAKIAAEIKATDSMLGRDKFESLNESVGLLKQGGFDEASVRLRRGIGTLREALATGNKELINKAKEDLELTRSIYNEAFELIGGKGSELLNKYYMGGMKQGKSDLGNTLNTSLKDKEKMNEIEKTAAEHTTKQTENANELVNLQNQKTAAQEKYLELLEKEDHIRDLAATREAKILEQDSNYKLMEEQNRDIRGNKGTTSFLMDQSIKYRDMMAKPWMTEESRKDLQDTFNNELLTRESQLEREIFQQQPDREVSTATVTEAITNANKQINQSQTDDKMTEQLNELKAIKQALQGNLFPVERIQ